MTDLSAVSAPGRQLRPDWTPRFIEVFAATGNVRLATTAAGVSRDAPYKRAQSSPGFASDWLRAREDAVDVLEAEARRRALTSSDALLIFLLKAHRSEVYRERIDIGVDLRREAERLAKDLGLSPDGLINEAERILELSRL
jgi:hypothetical protein